MIKGFFVSRSKREGRLLAARQIVYSLLASMALSFHVATAQSSAASAAETPKQDYLVYVVCESADKIVLLRFGPHGLQIENQTRTGLMPTDINGPHGIAVS